MQIKTQIFFSNLTHGLLRFCYYYAILAVLFPMFQPQIIIFCKPTCSKVSRTPSGLIRWHSDLWHEKKKKKPSSARPLVVTNAHWAAIQWQWWALRMPRGKPTLIKLWKKDIRKHTNKQTWATPSDNHTEAYIGYIHRLHVLMHCR